MDFLVGTEDGLFRVTDDARTAKLIPGRIRHVVASDEGAVALDAAGTLWNVDEDGALEFDELPTMHATCVLVDGDDVWLGTEGAHLVLLRNGEVQKVEAFDRVAGRDAWTTPWGDPPDVHSIDIDDDGTLYVAVHVGGIVRSSDGGQTWDQTPLDVATDVHQVCTVPDYAQTVIAACAGGMAISIDAGDTWEVDTEGLHATYSRAIAVAGDYVILGASDGSEGGRSGLFRRTLDGTIFSRCRTGLPPEWWSGNIGTHCIAGWDEVVVAGVPDGTVFMSTDSGDRWRQVAAGMPPVTAVAIL
jgi:photosystem II stability/assembly factor-like uncharacterized protein